jgi:hypothetical protein
LTLSIAKQSWPHVEAGIVLTQQIDALNSKAIVATRRNLYKVNVESIV